MASVAVFIQDNTIMVPYRGIKFIKPPYTEQKLKSNIPHFRNHQTSTGHQ